MLSESITNFTAESILIQNLVILNSVIGHMLDEVSRDANLILTTSSTSSLEFIAQGICVGVACAVDNQRQYYDSLGQLGVAAQIGLRNPSLGWDLDVETIRLLISRPDF